MMKNIWNRLAAHWERIRPSLVNFLQQTRDFVNTHRRQSATGGIAILVVSLVIMTIHSCTSSAAATAPTPGGGYFFWKLMLIGLVVAAIVSYRNNPANMRFPSVLIGGAGLCFLIVVGNFAGFFAWGVIGLPLFAAAGVWGYRHTEGRLKSFLGFASALAILAWMFLFTQANIRPNLKFLGDRIKDDTNLIIFFLGLFWFIFATWKRSRIHYLISLLILVAWIGNDVFQRIEDRTPKIVKAPVSAVADATKRAWYGLGELGKELKKQLENLPKATSSATSAAPKPMSALQRKKDTSPQPVKKRIKVVGGKNYSLENGTITIKRGGYIRLKLYDLPRLIPGRHKCELSFAGRRESDGVFWIEINWQRKAFSAFVEEHLGNKNLFKPIKFVFQGSSEIRFFEEGENLITLSSPEDKVTIQDVTFTVTS